MPLEYALQHKSLFGPANPWKVPTALKKYQVEAGELGIENIPKQTVKFARTHRFRLNIMIAGESGLGKSTFINTLFSSDLLPKGPKKITGKTVEIGSHLYEVEENGVNMLLNIVDTPGFGDQLNREPGIKPVVDYIETKYEEFFQNETATVFRKGYADERIHVLLYFISPNCHKLKELDLNSLKILSEKVNVIPIIAKADTLTYDERYVLKSRILTDLIKFDVKLYPNAFAEEESDSFNSLVPFSVIGVDNFVEVGGKNVRGRKYRWGVAEVENEAHCDFVQLRNMLISTNLRDIIDTCHGTHYYNFRAAKLRNMGRAASILQCDEQYESQIDNVRQKFQEDMIRREAEIREALFKKIKEKEASLRDTEEALARKERELAAELNEQRRQLEEEEREIELAIQRAAAGKKGKDGKR